MKVFLRTYLSSPPDYFISENLTTQGTFISVGHKYIQIIESMGITGLTDLFHECNEIPQTLAILLPVNVIVQLKRMGIKFI